MEIEQMIYGTSPLKGRDAQLLLVDYFQHKPAIADCGSKRTLTLAHTAATVVTVYPLLRRKMEKGEPYLWSTFFTMVGMFPRSTSRM